MQVEVTVIDNNLKEKIKTHINKYKVAYSCAVTAVVVAGITYVIMKGRHATLIDSVDGLKTADTSVTVRPFSFLSSQKNEIVTTIHTGVRGHPGFITHNLETDKFFATQAAAAKILGISERSISQHLNGAREHAEGYHFERVPFGNSTN